MLGKFDFSREKYGSTLLIDLVRLESLAPFLARKPIHELSYFDITLITGGEGEFSIDGKRTPLARGRVFATAPGQVRQWICASPPRGYALIFEEEFLTAFFRDARFAARLPLFDAGSPPDILLDRGERSRLARLFRDIEAEIRTGGPRDAHILRAMLYLIISLLGRNAARLRSAPRPAVSTGHAERFFRAVEAGFREHRSVGHYARLLCVSPGHLNDQVKRATGLGAKRHIQARAFLEAKRMLIHSDWTIDEIAARLRFPSASYFIKAFRAETGRTPLVYRRKNKP